MDQFEKQKIIIDVNVFVILFIIGYVYPIILYISIKGSNLKIQLSKNKRFGHCILGSKLLLNTFDIKIFTHLSIFILLQHIATGYTGYISFVNLTVT